MRVNPIFVTVLGVALSYNSFGQITGQVTLKGDPPDAPPVKGLMDNPQCAALHKNKVYEDKVLVGNNGELQNVIVFIKEDKPGELKGPQLDKPAVLDQKGCMYMPHVLAVQTGQPVLIKNSDPFLHNIHTLSLDNDSFNLAEIQGAQQKRTFDKAEQFPIKCDVHPWMGAIIRVFDNPYFSVTNEDGKYSIDTKGLKDGTYSIVAWHELYKESEPQQIEIKGGKATKPVNFTFEAKK